MPVSLEPKTTDLEEGEPAPFAGVLLNPAAAAKLATEKEHADAMCDARVRREVALKEAELQLEVAELEATKSSLQQRLELEQALNEEHVEALSLELERAQKRARAAKWAPLYFTGGVIAGVLVIVAGAYAVRGVRETQL